MTLTQLEYIIAVDKYRNFVKASKASHVSQPTLSVQIQKLESFLQTIIFDRTKKPVEPTMIGKKIISKARETLENVRAIEDIVLEEKENVQGEFILGIIPSIAGCLIPLFLQKFTSNFPKVKLSVVELKIHEIMVALKKGEIDAGIASTPLSDKDITETPLYWEPFYLFVNKKHALYQAHAISGKDLKHQNVLVMSGGSSIRNQVSQIFELNNFENNNNIADFESGNYQTLIQLVMQNMGVTLLPHLVATCMQEDQQMVKPFKGKVPVREVSLITTRTLVKKKITDALSSIIREVIPEEIQSHAKKKTEIMNPLESK